MNKKLIHINYSKRLITEVTKCPIKNEEGRVIFQWIKLKIRPIVKPNQKKLVKQIVRLVDSGMRQQDIGKKLGISQSKVSKYLKKGRLNDECDFMEAEKKAAMLASKADLRRRRWG